jgi:hypothetical protein
MQQIYRPGHPDRQRGAVAIELAIVAIAGFIVAVMGTRAMLGSSFFVTANGEIDVDGNDTILLSGIDELAVAKLKFMVEVTTDALVDLTPPNTVDDKQTDPDSSGLSPRTFISISWDEFTTNSAQCTVVFMGDSNGDYLLEKGERAEITIWLHQYDGTNVLYDLGAGTSDGFVHTATELLQQRGFFVIEIIVGGSTSLVLGRTLPLELGTSDLLD